MAGKTLEEYFVSLGIKGQNVVLKNIKDIKKQATDLSKGKTSVNLKGKGGGVVGNNIIPPQQSPDPWEQKEERKNNKKFSENINKFASGSKEFVKGVAHFDPVAAVQQTISSTGSALGAMAKAIPVIGDYIKDLPKGVADITNAFVGMGAGALQMAKESTAGQYAISNRNETMRYYGGGGIGQGGMSRAQHSELVMTIAGSFGKIQKPLQETVNKLVESKNTDALARVAGGNWASTGTDKGWFLQQISNETSGLPPSIAQAIQNSMLKSNADLIQEKGEEKGAQRLNATFQNQAEDQTTALYKRAAESEKSLTSLNASLNKMQISMFDSGVGMATQIDKAANKIKDLVESFDKMKKAVDNFSVMGHGSPQFIKDMFK
jgi:hypothetical protein